MKAAADGIRVTALRRTRPLIDFPEGQFQLCGKDNLVT